MIRSPLRVVPGRVLLAMAAVAALRAQDEALAERIANAVTQPDYHRALQAAGVDEVPFGALVDTVATLRGRLQGHLWARAMGPLTADRNALPQLWQLEPGRRRARAAVFAEALDGLVDRYVKAGAEERADLVAVSRFQRPEPWADEWRHDGAERRPAELLLQRTRAAADGEAAAEVLACLRDLGPGKPGAWLLTVGDGRHGPFSLQKALVVPDPTIARRAAIALRLMLRLSVPERLSHGGRDDAALVQLVQNRVSFGDGVAASLDKLLDDLAADREFGGWGASTPLDAAQRRRLAKALISYALRIPAPPWHEMSAQRPGLRARDVADQRASTALQFAAALGDDEKAAVLSLAVASPRVHVTLRVLMALGAWSRAAYDFEPPAEPEQATRLAPILLALLDHEDPQVVERAATVCAKVVPGAPDSRLAEVVGDRALAALRGKAPLRSELPQLGGFCGTPGPTRAGFPANAASWYVFSACAAGDARLLVPLLAGLREFVDADGKWRIAPEQAPRHELLMLALVQLCRHVDAAGARQVHELLAPTIEPAPPRTGVFYMPVPQKLARSALAAALPVLPDELLVWYAALPREERHGMPWATDGVERLDGARANLLIGRSDEDRDAALLHVATLCLQAPERIAAAWRAGGTSREAAKAAITALGTQRGAALASAARDGVLPRALVAPALCSAELTLAALAQVAPTDPMDLADAKDWQYGLAMAIEKAPASDVAGDLAALAVLAATPVEVVAFAAVRRAAALGDEGRAFAATALSRRADATTDVEELARVVELAVQLGVQLDDLEALLPRLDDRLSWRAGLAADAAAMRFLGRDPRRCTSGYAGQAIQLAGVDVDEDTMRAVIGEPWDRQSLAYVVGPLLRAAPTTILSTLQVVGELSYWDGAVQRDVANCTAHDDPKVRLAAYRTLATRDAEVWPCALLVHEAVFDPDPAVRRFGQGMRR
ncbi:MAG: hypothetical protein H6835_08440 [Planctomycetes bacterium]|nr:hypothetical protein [Planctomycetota bacterium]